MQMTTINKTQEGLFSDLVIILNTAKLPSVLLKTSSSKTFLNQLIMALLMPIFIEKTPPFSQFILH